MSRPLGTVSVFVVSLFLMGNSLQSQTNQRYTIVIHGGAGSDPAAWSDEQRQLRRAALGEALDHGTKMLSAGAAALDVVEQVVRKMEDNEIFNAGRGCVLNQRGEHELDASIMDGTNLACGAVAGSRLAKNPISLARRVMTDTKHVLLIGDGADEFAEMLGVELEQPDYFRTARQIENWQRWQNKQAAVDLHRAPGSGEGEQLYLGTVGCVVLDSHGNLAAATSTGGLMGKRWGRVGDSPIIGAGNYADNATCAVSGTGVGEEFIRRNVAADIAARMRYAGSSLVEATRGALAQLPENCGGIIAVDAQGNLALEFNTPGMSRGYATADGQRVIQLARER